MCFGVTTVSGDVSFCVGTQAGFHSHMLPYLDSLSRGETQHNTTRRCNLHFDSRWPVSHVAQCFATCTLLPSAMWLGPNVTPKSVSLEAWLIGPLLTKMQSVVVNWWGLRTCTFFLITKSKPKFYSTIYYFFLMSPTYWETPSLNGSMADASCQPRL